ncbi:MAG TPA: translocation/assembly module TamB domain-containing protein [Bacteroidia bacterium]|nr:translocation/assembly module TamB domain-containing protein [Bacteroidia bacterium]
MKQYPVNSGVFMFGHMYILRKFFKILLWIAGSIVTFVILFAIIIQVPVVQNFLVHKATTFVSNKTGSKVEIAKVGITFPKSVFIDGLFLGDLLHDTLLYAGNVKVNLDMIGLIKGNVHLHSVSLEHLTGNIYRTENDSLFNFNFLLAAFADSTQSKVDEKPKTKPAEFTIDEISLAGIKLKYDDQYGGVYANINLHELDLKMNELNLPQSKYDIEKLLVDGLNGRVEINKKSTDTTNQSSNQLPWLLADKLEIKNSAFDFNDNVSSVKIIVGIKQFELNKADINLNTETISSDKISLAQSSIRLNFKETVKTHPGTGSNENIKSNWKVTLKEIDLHKNDIAYNIINKPGIKNSFDASHINYRNVTVNAENVFYSAAMTNANIKQISAEDTNGLTVKNISADFRMDEHSVFANNLKLQTITSNINSSVELKFASLASLKDSMQNLFVNANFNPATISAKDILYFSPQLATKPFFNEIYNTVTLSGSISGVIKNLKGENILVNTGGKTSLKTNFVITGLPDINKAYFDFPDLKIISGRNDLTNLLGDSVLPQNISVPENIHVSAKFRGRVKAFESFVGVVTEYGHLSAYLIIDKQEKFTSKININNFNAGLLMKDTNAFGRVTLRADVDGKGLDKNTVVATVKVNAPSLYLNKYVYQNLSIDGNVTGQQFEGKISLNDTNAAFDFNGLVNITPGKEQYKFSLNIEGADLKNLNVTNDDLRISAKAVADLKGKDFSSISGSAGITEIIVAKHGIKYHLDSVMYASINEKRKSEMSVSSAIIGIKYNGTFAPGNMIQEIKNHIDKFFPVLNKKETRNAENEPQQFNFEIQLHNHPLLSEVFLPGLTEFEPGIITGNFNSEKDELVLNADIHKIIYAGTEINNLKLSANSDRQKFDYGLTAGNISTAQFKLENFTAGGRLADQKAFLNISSINENGNKKLLIKTVIEKQENGYKISLRPNEFYLGNEQWTLPADNYFAFNDKGFLIHNISFSKSTSQINIASVNNKYNDDIKIGIKNFELVDISRIIEKDTAIIEGRLDADVLLKKVNNTYGLIAGATLTDLAIKKVKVGTLTLNADNPTAEKFTIDVKLKGEGNDIAIDGYFIPKESANSLNIHADINNLSIKTAEAFSMGQISEGSGSIKGNFVIEGNSKEPVINGNLIFNDAYFRPAALNNRLHVENEKIEIKPTGIYFNNFVIKDQENNSASVNGAVTMKQFSDFGFAATVDANDFLIFNTTKQDNKLYYGRMIMDSHINLKGTMDFPVVDATVKLKEGSNFTFAVPEEKLSVDRGENVVLFTDSLRLNPIMTRNEETEKQKSDLKGFDIAANIEVDDKATLRLLLDPSTKDSLVVRGNAALSFILDPSGKISLTGSYSLTDGSYIVSLQSLIKKKFDIESGSTITWNGDPLDADVSINAIYTIRTSAVDLVADQVSGLSDETKNSYRERLTFFVYLKMRGAILKPEISFEIQLSPGDKGALGGAVNAKLNQLNEDPSALNKQVFALLVLGRFIQENPLESSGGGNAIASVARGSVGSFLSAQLNQLGSHVLPGVELKFDVQSYEDYTSGQAEGRTEIGIGVRKELLNERLSIQVGGAVDVEGERSKQNSASDITGNVILEYKITEDGRYRLKGYRENVYDDPIEGELVETGGGILYTRDFERWKEFFKSPKKKEDDKKINPENK